MIKSVLVIGDYIDDVVVKPLSQRVLDSDTEASITTQPGGQGLNVASWLATAGVSVDLAARVGAGDRAAASNMLEKLGIGNLLQADQNHPTGAIVVIVDGATRSFFTQRGANANLDLDLIGDLDKYQLVYLSGYAITNSNDQMGVQRLLARILESGIPLAVDPGSAAFIESYGVANFLDQISSARFLFPSLEEGKLLSGESRPELAARFLAERVESVVVTAGVDGSYFASGELAHHQPALPAVSQDPTGAGDAFAAGFIAKFLDGGTPTECLVQGSRFGALAVGNLGAGPALHQL